MRNRYLLLFPALFFVFVIAKAQQPAAQAKKPYKYVIKGGHVIDPKNNINAVMDIAISQQSSLTALDGKIALIAKNIDPNLGVQVIDATGLYITPGLVDIHSHDFPGMRPGDPDPDGFTFRTGVTTTVDAGSSGWKSFENFKKQIIDRSQTRILALLNIVGEGMAGPEVEESLNTMDVQKTVEMAKKYPDIIVGVKNAHFGNGNDPSYPANAYLIPIERGIEAAKQFGGYFMLDGKLDEEVMKRFRPGDIYTHIFTRAILGPDNKVKPFILQAQKRGVIFDLGFGRSSFRFAMAIPAFKAGFYPNSISSDMNSHSINNAMKDLLNVMDMVMAMGLDLQTVIKLTTMNAAKEIKREELGNLSVGGVADIAIFNLRQGKFGFYDSAGEKISGSKRLETEMTIRGGEIVYNLNGLLKPGPQVPSRPANSQ